MLQSIPDPVDTYYNSDFVYGYIDAPNSAIEDHNKNNSHCSS